MTGRSAPYGIPDPTPPGSLRPPAAGQVSCRGGSAYGARAVGTHYLTCPDLRLPSGYRLSDAPRA